MTKTDAKYTCIEICEKRGHDWPEQVLLSISPDTANSFLVLSHIFKMFISAFPLGDLIVVNCNTDKNHPAMAYLYSREARGDREALDFSISIYLNTHNPESDYATLDEMTLAVTEYFSRVALSRSMEAA